jgi:hypothetical protein
MESKLEKQARYLKTYIIVAALLCGVSLTTNFSLQSRRVSADCISLTGKNGEMTMILTVPAGATAGSSSSSQGRKTAETEDVRYPGMIFYN